MGCKHNHDLGFDYPCMRCDPTPDDPRLRSVGFSFGPAGREHWHSGQTNREWEAETIANAKRYDIEPEYVGPRSARIPNSVFHE